MNEDTNVFLTILGSPLDTIYTIDATVAEKFLEHTLDALPGDVWKRPRDTDRWGRRTQLVIRGRSPQILKRHVHRRRNRGGGHLGMRHE